MANPKEGIELWPVVDRQDRIIGYASEALFDQIGTLRTRNAFVIAYNTKGYALLQQRSLNKSRYPGYWTVSASGHVRANESYAETARREYIEELGVEPEGPITTLAKMRIDDPTNLSFSMLFQTIANGSFSPDPSEVERVKYYSEREIRKIVDQITPPSRMLLEAAGLL